MSQHTDMLQTHTPMLSPNVHFGHNWRMGRRTEIGGESFLCVCGSTQKAVVCDGRQQLEEEHGLVDQDCESDIPCVIQWVLLWFSAPSRSNRYYEDNGTYIEAYFEVTSMIRGLVVNLTMEITLHVVPWSGLWLWFWEG